ncbi:uncharacterized protein LOC129590346 [Paramacrobiotus metropolitanus]|uniref:uncharacterized protein LOC129590346 n=1 Tax=Paramacrobiotus metropolitanus TaxID=2943436 RepID=UPI002445C512|nr:uncharacterized protein LOC129590346 [Paramacrobiotus metropolitanus]XP_055341496.1 uncharacterized protein LOC129590346 [Paramacrobiotus metropolitanus]XP_055341497.1 uncharacterized protein LOC129590346 [Paramacrobiotus metropolitanus]XP_055341498.1 uncharacterized protein LOC129590346 [Paramacrobiotus metropolitanus]XP_055341499.1 uncharacterized protein LOC129590346 [Paramacrobiotus metropolitanus]XP_055341500.1 uncharacterized protein LOC129590346 [Paramacrobiotus metropolitanus]
MAEMRKVANVYVLQSSEPARQDDPDEWSHALAAFFSLMDQAMHSGVKEQWLFVFVDPCMGGHGATPGVDAEQASRNLLQHYQHGQLICENILALDQREIHVPTAKSLLDTEPSEKAKKRGNAEFPCPLAAKKNCSEEKELHRWKCSKCSQALEYGFDGYLYCDCGKAPADSFVFNCGKTRHGRDYVGFGDVKAVLKTVKPFKEINILILGETGVGKSTWINGFVNFLTYATLDEALAEPVYLIPAQFTTMDQNFDEKIIFMKALAAPENEDTMTGQSATQMPKSYVFKKGNILVRLIDTPGIGDTSGTEQDKKNFVNIMQHLSNYDSLHGICILLKPNSARLTVMFQFCIKELLTHLHRDACHNITFVFTNARGTFYRPGDTMPILKKLIKDSKGVNITLNKDTVYCVDSEAVRFMAAMKAGVEFDQTEKDNFIKSWEKSVEETERLLKYISERPPHVLQNTLSLNEARRMILSFTEPLAQITRNIQLNLKLADDKADEIKATKYSREELKRKLYVPVLDLEPVQLGFPRTVCISQKCIKMVGQKVNYITWCHEHCYLTGIVPNQYPQPGLKSCAAMSPTGGLSCAHCQCSWEKHMHITYELQETEIKEVDPNIQDLLRQKDGQIAAVELLLHDLQQRKMDLTAEEEQIRKVSAKFGYFLKKNAMIPYNDAMEEYLRYLISAEYEKIAIGASRDNLENYQKMLNAYREEKRILEDAMQNQDEDRQITAKDIKDAIRSLYSLPINGQTIRDLVDVVQGAHGQQQRHSEIFYSPKHPKNVRKAKKRNGMQRLMDVFDYDYGDYGRHEGERPYGRGAFDWQRMMEYDEDRRMEQYGGPSGVGRVPWSGAFALPPVVHAPLSRAPPRRMRSRTPSPSREMEVDSSSRYGVREFLRKYLW